MAAVSVFVDDAIRDCVRSRLLRHGIDVTRRWVTLSNVHPNFIDAVNHRVSTFH